MSSIENPPPPPIERVCPTCGNILKKEWKACPSCGWTMKKTSHVNTVVSIVLSAVGWFFFGILFSLMAIGFGATAISKDKDKLGYIAVIFGIITLIFSILAFFDTIFNPYSYY